MRDRIWNDISLILISLIMKFKTTKKWNVQEQVYSIMNTYYELTGSLVNLDKVLQSISSIRYDLWQASANKETIKRSYRRMRKVIEWKIIQRDIDRKQIAEDSIRIQLANKARRSKFHDDAIIRMIAITLAIATLIVCWVVLYNIFTYV